MWTRHAGRATLSAMWLGLGKIPRWVRGALGGVSLYALALGGLSLYLAPLNPADYFSCEALRRFEPALFWQGLRVGMLYPAMWFWWLAQPLGGTPQAFGPALTNGINAVAASLAPTAAGAWLAHSREPWALVLGWLLLVMLGLTYLGGVLMVWATTRAYAC